MAKQSGAGTSRAGRKAARLRKNRAEVRGLPVQPEPAARAAQVAPPARARQAASQAVRSRVPLAVKVVSFLVLLLVAVWWAAHYRKGLLD